MKNLCLIPSGIHGEDFTSLSLRSQHPSCRSTICQDINKSK